MTCPHANSTRLWTCHQLQLDFNHLLSHLSSAESGLHDSTRLQLRGLPVCADMRQGLAVLTGEREEMEEGETPLLFEGELGRLIHSLAVVQNVSRLNAQDWR